VASSNHFHVFNSFFILSNIRIFASIAIPTDNINQAIEARVNTIPSIFTIVSTIAIYISSAIAEINQAALYIITKNNNISKNHEIQANISFSNDEAHNLESIVFSLVRYIGAGTTHVLIFCANSLASSGV